MDDKAIKLFSEKNLVFIATTMKDGSPQVSLFGQIMKMDLCW